MVSLVLEARRGVVHSVALIMAVAIGVVGCASRRGTPAPAQAQDGTYDFFARASDRTELRGSLIVLAGTHSLRPENGICREDQLVVSAESTRYICDHSSDVEDLVFVVDRRFPLTRSMWTGRVRQRKQRTVCAQYAIQNGRQVCVRTTQEWYEEVTSVRGPMTFRPRPVSQG